MTKESKNIIIGLLQASLKDTFSDVQMDYNNYKINHNKTIKGYLKDEIELCKEYKKALKEIIELT